MTAVSHIVLAGGGYAHLHVLRQLASQASDNTRYSFVSPHRQLPYTGMLPGYLAGLFSEKAIHIDAAKLCERAGVHFIEDRLTGFDRRTKTARLLHQGDIPADILSINTGPMPDSNIPGADRYGISLKPVADFLPVWPAVLERVRRSDKPLQLVMVGGGAGSVEVAIAMQLAFGNDAAVRHKPSLELLTSAERILPDRPLRLSQLATSRCEKSGIRIHTRASLHAVHETALDTSLGEKACDLVFLCTGAQAPAWPSECGLACDEQGFISTDRTLQSINTPGVFAAGDIASFSPPLPKAGVFSVRQGPVLTHNLGQQARGGPLIDYTPQTRFLSLLFLGHAFAGGSYANVPFSGHWVWAWKKHIDRKFMRSYQQLTE